MVLAHSFPSLAEFTGAIDGLLFDICDHLQLSTARYGLAVERYNTLNRVLESEQSPFRFFQPEIYPQGSMALGTTVKPVEGPHDLDFVLQLSRDHHSIDPMSLIRTLYGFLKNHGTYGPMVSPKNRCVRITYADEFYMDVLPACHNIAAGGTCIKVPDRALRAWSDSNPIGYLEWFKQRSRILLLERVLDRAAPIPAQQAVSEKSRLHLAVQLLKRWRDLYYASKDTELAPISVALTTLAAYCYRGEPSISSALATILNGIVALIDASRRNHEKYLRVLNPSNPAEDLTERWDSNPAAYIAFESGIRAFTERWSRLMTQQENVNSELETLFGEPIKAVIKKRAQQLQESRLAGNLGVTASGIISPVGPSVIPARPNTFYGSE